MPKKDREIQLKAFSLDDDVEKQIRQVLGRMLMSRGCVELLPSLYTCVKELVVNAVKANYKNIYFEGSGPEILSSKGLDYNAALELFKLEMGRDEARYLGELARRAEMFIEMKFILREDHLYFSVTNSGAMSETELEGIKRKRKAAKKYGDITDYFLDIDNELDGDEGAGLGLILISIMLKNLGLRDENFDIFSERDITTAFIYIPLTEMTLQNFYARVS